MALWPEIAACVSNVSKSMRVKLHGAGWDVFCVAGQMVPPPFYRGWNGMINGIRRDMSKYLPF